MLMCRYFLLLFLLFGVALLADELPVAPNQYDEDGLRSGKWVERFDRYWKPVDHDLDCVYYREIEYEKGKPKGTVSDFYRNGTLRMKTKLESVNPDVLADTTVVVYHDNGTMQAKGAFKNGKQNGVWITWHPNGNKASEGFYIEGKLDGDWQKWYPNGTPEGKGAYRNNYADGKWTMWFPDGKKRSEGVIRFERKQGIWKEWDNRGNREEGEYENDIRTGYWTTWDSTGFMTSEGDYRQGNRDGKWRIYRPDGTTIHGQFSRNLREGGWLARNAGGKLIWVHEYRRGVPDGQWVDYDVDGSYYEGLMQHGLRQGIWRRYDSDGVIRRECGFLNGQEHGECVFYDAVGMLREVHRSRIWNPIDDFWYDEAQPVPDGVSIVYYPDGALLSTIDCAEGTAYYYLEDGTLRTKIEQDRIYRLEPDGSWYEGVIDHGVRDGICREYSDSTGVPCESLWLDGEQTGLCRYKYDDGSTESGILYRGVRTGWWISGLLMQKYKDGIANGEFRRYEEDGTLRERGTVLNALREGHWQVFDRLGAVVTEGDYTDGRKDGVWLETFSSGNYAVGTYVLGKMTGKWAYFDSNNRSIAEGLLQNGLRQGYWVERTPAGNILQGNYIDGLREGEWTLIDSAGRLYSKGSYRAGEKTGEWVLFDKSGVIMKRTNYGARQ